MFVDQVKIFVKGGDGGNGMVAFRREKYVPLGGPAGGDGGRGGNIIFQVDEGLRTLMDFRYQKHFHADRGENGRSKSQHGAAAKDRVVKVPPGTIVKNVETEEILADLKEHGETAVIVYGGRGGRGNIRFATPANPAPKIAENGEPGEERWIELELKLLADVGLIGYPSVGKSTLLATVTAARPKIGAYPFTTLVPNLGVVQTEDGRSFVMADLPGLIEGAHQGVGLGHQFLRHVERTKVLVHVLDMAGSEGRDPYEDWKQINQELTLYQKALANRPQIIVANKMDLPDAEEQLALFREHINQPIYPISAATRQGITELLYAIADRLDEQKDTEVSEVEMESNEDRKIYRINKKADSDFTIRRENDVYIVEGERVEKLVKMTNFNYTESLLRFAKMIQKMGVEEALRAKGAKDGDTIQIGEIEFELSDTIDFEEG